MGRGDKRSKRGKISRGTNGKKRPSQKNIRKRKSKKAVPRNSSSLPVD